MRFLLICDDLWHPAEPVVRGLSFLNELGHTFDVVMDAKDVLTPAMLDEYDAVIIAKGNSLNAANANAVWFDPGVTLVSPEVFRSYVENGGAMLVLHAGTVFSPVNCECMTSLIGAYFVTHPKQCPVTIHITDASHPITAGMSDVKLIQDEHYQIKLTDDNSKVIFETVSEHGAQPAGLVREIGKGRICVFTPGHNTYVLNEPGYSRLIMNALEWLTGKR